MMPINLDDLKSGFELLKSAIGLAKEAKDLLPDSDKKKTIVSSLDTAERTTALAEAQIAKSLGYHLCQCTFPPQVMLSKGYQPYEETFECPNCKMKWPLPETPHQGRVITDYNPFERS